MSVLSGQLISRTGRYKVWPVIGLTLMIVGIGALSRIGVDTPYWQVALMMVVVGWGLGANMQPLTLAVQNAMPPRDMGVATASATFFRQMGGTLGTAVFLSLLFGTLGIADRRQPPGRGRHPAVPRGRRRPGDGCRTRPTRRSSARSRATARSRSTTRRSCRAADPVLARPILEGFAGAMSVVFLAAAAVLVLGLVAVLMMRELPLRTQSGVDARRAEELERRPAENPIETLRTVGDAGGRAGRGRTRR